MMLILMMMVMILMMMLMTIMNMMKLMSKTEKVQVGRQPINYRPAVGEVGQLVRFVIMIRPNYDQT